MKLLLALLFLFAQTSALALSASGKSDNVTATLLSDTEKVTPGKPFTVAVRLAMAPHWHTYWQNPGDSGLATTITWDLPPGFKAGPIQWPAPRRLPLGTPPNQLVNFGYEGEALLLTELTPPAGFVGSAEIKAKVEWLECKDVCIPGAATLGLTLPHGSEHSIEATSAIQAAKTALPQAWRGAAHASQDGTNALLALRPDQPSARSLRTASRIDFFPFAEGKIESNASQKLERFEEGLTLTLARAKQPVGDFTKLHGLVVAANAQGQPLWSAEVNAPWQTQPAPPLGNLLSSTVQRDGISSPLASAAPSAPLGLLAALGLAFVGGLILNLMPCVFPVLSLKVLAFAQPGGGAQARAHGLVFATGIVLSFLALAGVLVALRAGGQEIGWGFQLQSPAVIVGLAALFFLLALNLAGVFEFAFGAVDAGASSSSTAGLRSAFGNGVLAVVAASPCTAPFMGAALGYAITQSIGEALAVFAALGLGMALPYVLLAWFPGWAARLPRPGAWMLRFKQFLSFPLFATVVWLAWVLGVQVGVDGVAWLLLGLTALGMAAWAWGISQVSMLKKSIWQGFSAIAAGMALWMGFLAHATPESSIDKPLGASVPNSALWQAYSASQVAELVAAGKPVFIDFTAAWCVSCQVNKKAVLGTPATEAAFAAKNVVLMRADWTKRDPEIARAIHALGRSGVPVYVLYRPNQAPLLLPELLTSGIVQDALKTMP